MSGLSLVRRSEATRWLGMIGVLLAGTALISGCTTTKIPMTDIKVPMVDVPLPNIPLPPLPKIPLLSRGQDDFRFKSWSKAFEKMNERMIKEYPFTEWKNVNWEALYQTYAPRIAEARKKKDRQAYYLALREYMYSVPDGHMRIEMNDGYRNDAIGGGYGFSAIRLDDGRWIAHVLLKDGPAAQAGMVWGAEIVQWNDKPTADAVAQTSVCWADTPPATTESRLIEQGRLFSRGPVGAEVSVVFKNPGETEPKTVKLKAVSDKYEALNVAKLYNMDLSKFESPIQAQILPSGYGYIRVYFLSPTMTTPFPAQAFQNAVQKVIKDKVPGIIIDVRGNTGGDPTLVPKLVGHFVSASTFYQDVALLNDKTGQFQLSPDDRLVIESRNPAYTGPVAVLVDQSTIGAGEGIPMVLAPLPNVTTIGLYATNGSFGITGGDITMPTDYVLSYPVGRSLNEQGQIQIDGNAKGEGGVAPEIRVPLTEATVRALFVDHKDLLLDKAVEALNAAQAAAPKS